MTLDLYSPSSTLQAFGGADRLTGDPLITGQPGATACSLPADSVLPMGHATCPPSAGGTPSDGLRPPGAPEPGLFSSSDSDSSGADPPPHASEQHSLLQIRTHLKPAACCPEDGSFRPSSGENMGASFPLAGATEVRIFQFGQSPVHLWVGVTDRLGTGASLSIIPVYPQGHSCFQCLALPAPIDCSGLPALSSHPGTVPAAVFLPSGSLATHLRRHFGLPPGHFQLSGHPWNGPSDGWLPGMCLVFFADSIDLAGHPVGAIPQSLLGASLSGAREALKCDRAPALGGQLRAIPTPVRNGACAAKLHLAEIIPPPPPAFAIGVEASMLGHCLSGHHLEGLGHCLPRSSKISRRLRSRWD